VIHQGQADDCVIDTSDRPETPIRVWVPRDPDDVGTVTVEVYRRGQWLAAHDEPEERDLLHLALLAESIDQWSKW